MNHPDINDAEDLWERIAPRLDEALAQLNAIERDALLWRYFERCTSEQIGGRLGLLPTLRKSASRAPSTAFGASWLNAAFPIRPQTWPC